MSPVAADAQKQREDRIVGALLGGAVGDALGLPREGLSARRARRMFGDQVRHAFFLRRGMISDDTEHACLVGQSLLISSTDSEQFAAALAWRLRFWLLGLPAGIGRATLRAGVKLWLGFPPHRSGVRSAGNGPAMRAPLLGVCLADDPEQLTAFVQASTRITHIDLRAEEGALLVARAAARAAHDQSAVVDPASLLDELLDQVTLDELRQAIGLVRESLLRGDDPAEYARQAQLRRGVTGYICHTVPAALFCWLRYPRDFRASVEAVIRLGGDADSTAAIVGSLAGATLGASAIPEDWLTGLVDWPRSVTWLRRLASRLACLFEDQSSAAESGPEPLFWPGILPRNAFFLAIVLGHGFRRSLPPY
jgi:ADP-ribosylglycohydrolase